jgi:predicted solute-binding protein
VILVHRVVGNGPVDALRRNLDDADARFWNWTLRMMLPLGVMVIRRNFGRGVAVFEAASG